MTDPAALDDPADRPYGPPGPTVLRLGAPDDVLAAVPFLLGFHPRDSLVAIALRGGPSQRNCLTARADLPPPTRDRQERRRVGRELARMCERQGAEGVLLVAYTDDGEHGRLVLEAAGRAFERLGMEVVEALRADGSRWWSHLCTNPDCCPPHGTPYDLSVNAVTAEAVWAGRTVLGDREDLRASVAPPAGAERSTQEEAAARARADLLAKLDAADGDGATAMLLTHGVPRVATLISDHLDAPAPLDHATVAELSVLTLVPSLRDAAWTLITADVAERHVELWRAVVRRAVPPYDVAPATLLAFAAWLDGDGALALCALERALGTDPDDSLALLLLELLEQAVPPSAWPAP